MGYQLRTETMTLDEIKAKSADNYVEEVIGISLDEVIKEDFEGFLRTLEIQLVGYQGTITDLEYTVVGNGLYDELHIKVSGYVELAGEE